MYILSSAQFPLSLSVRIRTSTPCAHPLYNSTLVRNRKCLWWVPTKRIIPKHSLLPEAQKRIFSVARQKIVEQFIVNSIFLLTTSSAIRFGTIYLLEIQIIYSTYLFIYLFGICLERYLACNDPRCLRGVHVVALVVRISCSSSEFFTRTKETT